MAAARIADDADLADATSLQGTLLCIEHGQASTDAARCWLADHPGVKLIHAGSGLDGVRMAHAEQPDFVLLDMRLPDIGGVEVVRRLNDEIAGRGLRVTILTADHGAMDTIRAMSLGAFEYWPKPLQSGLFQAGLRRALTGRRPDPAHALHSLR
jgi:DNA-binding response OmpR family regulator